MAELSRVRSELVASYHTLDQTDFCRYLGRIVQNLPSVVASRSIAPAQAAMAGRQYPFRFDGHTIVLDGSLFGLAQEIYGRKVYFAFPEFRLMSGDVVVDLGSHAGVFTTLAALVSQRVVAVEAQRKFVDEVWKNVRTNRCAARASVEWGLVGQGSGVFSDPAKIREASHYAGDPPLLTMEELFARRSIEWVDFLKVDIEGSEFDLFARDAPWLSRVEKIAMEVHPQFGDVAVLSQRLQEHGFEVRLLDHLQKPVRTVKDRAGFLFALRLRDGD